MNKFSIFIDESGTADIKTYSTSKLYVLCGLVIKNDHRAKLREEIALIKRKYFRNDSYILHLVEIRGDLHNDQAKIKNFASDLKKCLCKYDFFLMYVVTDKKKAFERSWIAKTAYTRGYRQILGNLVKFLIAKNASSEIYVEASNSEQDIHIYQNFFHYITNGIPTLGITPEIVKQHFTSLCAVTKLNNDVEAQLADLFAICGKLHFQHLVNKAETISPLDTLNQTLYELMKKKIFKVGLAKKEHKKTLYNAIDSFIILP